MEMKEKNKGSRRWKSKKRINHFLQLINYFYCYFKEKNMMDVVSYQR